MKKNILALSLVFLFVFTFALSFTLTTTARAEGGGCCINSFCPGTQAVSQMGHKVWDYYPLCWHCWYDGSSPCDYTYLCP